MSVIPDRPDVLIVGGGVAGSALATVLARRGCDVHLVERETRFRDRIRGETIHPWGVAELRALDLYSIAMERAEAQEQRFWQRYVDREAQPAFRWADDFPDAPNGLGFFHPRLQESMIAAAAEAGASVHRPAKVQLSRVADRAVAEIETTGASIHLEPRLVVGADGEHSATRGFIGGSLHADPPHHHLGGVLIEGLDLASDRIHQAYFEGGFVFVSPQANNTARLYLVISSEEARRIRVSDNPPAAFVERLRESTPEGMLGTEWRAIGPAGFFPNNGSVLEIPSSRDVVLIGDAAGRNDPSQGHGLSLAIHDVRILSELLESEVDWSTIPDAFHTRRSAYAETLRQHAIWNARLATETGSEIDSIKAAISRAREVDPTAGGFAAIYAIGPDRLVADESARRHFFGEDLANN